MATRRLTYGGLPVTQEYLDRYGVTSDQAVYEAIAVIIGAFAVLLAIAAICLWIWA